MSEDPQRPRFGGHLIPPEWLDAVKEDLYRNPFGISDELMRDYQRRLDCEFLGIDPDYVPPRWKRPILAYRRC